MAERTDIQPGFVTSPIFGIGGQQTTFYPFADPQKCEVLTNVELTERGTADRRYGYAKYNSNQITETAIAKSVTGLLQQKFTNMTTRNLVIAGTKVYSADTTTAWASLDVTGTAEVANDGNARLRFAFIDNQVFGTCGTVRPWVIGASGNAAVLASSIPFAQAANDYCKDFVVHRNVLVALNTKENGTAFPTRLRWCDVNRRTFVIDPTVWIDSNRFEVYDEGAPIVGGTDNFGRLLVFKEDGLYPCLLNYNTGFIEVVLLENQVYRGFSPVAKNSIISRSEFTWVICQDGGYIVIPNGEGFETKLVTGDVQYDWNNSINLARLQYAVSYIREKDHQVRTLLSSSSSSSGFDKELIYDWQTGQVWFDTPSGVFNYATSFKISSVEYDWKGTTNGYVMQANDEAQVTDDGTPFFWNIKTHPNDFGLPGKDKLINKVITIYREQSSGSQTIENLIHLDEGRKPSRLKNLTFDSSLQYDTGLLYDTGLRYPGGTVRLAETFVNRNAKTVAVQWRGYNAFSVIGYQVVYKPLEN